MLLVALRRFGHAGAVEERPDPAEPDLLARIRLGPPHAVTEEDRRLFAAIPHRHSTRTAYAPLPLSEPLLTAMRAAALAEEVELVVHARRMSPT
jgi:hypothetical protein